MIRYTQYASETKNRIKELAWMQGQPLVCIGMGAVPLAVYFLFVGYLEQVQEALLLGWSAIVLSVVCFSIYCIRYFSYKKALTENFAKYAVEDKIEWCAERIDGETLSFTRINDGTTFRVGQSEIKAVRRLKTIFVIVLKNKNVIDLPICADTDELIFPYDEEKE